METSFLSFSPRLREMVESGFTIDEAGEKVPLSGASTLNNLYVIRNVIRQRRAQSTLEIGLARGVSALTILHTIAEHNGRHTAIDPFQHTTWRGSGLKVIQEEGLDDRFSLVDRLSSVALPSLWEADASFDFIYVDGSHLFEDVFVDFYYCARLLQRKGVVLFDDCRDPHVAKLIRFVRRNYSRILKPIDLSAFEHAQKPLRKRIANRLGIRQLTGFEKIDEPPRAWNAPFRPF